MKNKSSEDEPILSSVERTKVYAQQYITLIQICGMLLVVIALALMTSNYFTGAENIWQSVITALAGIYFGLFKTEDRWTSTSILVVALVFTLFIILEYFIIGLPDQLVPHYPATNTEGDITLLGILNHLSPWIYLTIKCIVAMVILMVIKRIHKTA